MLNQAATNIIKIFLFGLSLFCLVTGLSIGLQHTYQLLTPGNYPFGPTGDGAYDAARIYYPILTGELPIRKLLVPFADHRIVVERLFAIADFVYTKGLESTLPLRLTIILWCTALLEVFAISKIDKISVSLKILLSGLAVGFTFFACSIINYQSVILCTWPLIMLFTMTAFICCERYCNLSHINSANSTPFLYLTAASIILAMFTFNIGNILWPIIFFTLWKRDSLKKRWKTWLGFCLFSYLIYFFRFQPHSAQSGIDATIADPVLILKYLSRMLSLPFIPSAQSNDSAITFAILLLVNLSSVLMGLYFLTKKWKPYDSVIFSMLAFGFVTVWFIAMARAPVVAEYVSIGLRFTTSSLFLVFALCFASTVVLRNIIKNELFLNLILILTFSFIFLVYAIPGDKKYGSGVGKFSRVNQDYFIALATGIPLDNNFVLTTSSYNNENDLNHLNFLQNVQKKWHKSVYSFWAANTVGKKLEELGLKQTTTNYDFSVTTEDFREKNVSAVLTNVQLSQVGKPTLENDQIIFGSSDNTIVGFALYFNEIRGLQDLLKKRNGIWHGAVNTSLVQDKEIQVYLVNTKNMTYSRVGQLEI